MEHTKSEAGPREDLAPRGERFDYGHRQSDDLRAVAQSWLNNERRPDEKCVGGKLKLALEPLAGSIAGRWIGRMPFGVIELKDLVGDGYLAALEWLRECGEPLPEGDVLEAALIGAITRRIKQTHEDYVRSGNRIRTSNPLTPAQQYRQLEEERLLVSGDDYRSSREALRRIELLEGVCREVRGSDRELVRAIAGGCTNAELGENLGLEGSSPDEAARKRRKAMQKKLAHWLVAWGYVLDAEQETFSIPAEQPTQKQKAGDYPKPLETAAAAVPCEALKPSASGRGKVAAPVSAIEQQLRAEVALNRWVDKNVVRRNREEDPWKTVQK